MHTFWDNTSTTVSVNFTNLDFWKQETAMQVCACLLKINFIIFFLNTSLQISLLIFLHCELFLLFNYSSFNRLRLPCPEMCPKSMYKLMCQCWEYDSRNRPGFSILVTNIRAISMQIENSHHHQQQYRELEHQQSPPLSLRPPLPLRSPIQTELASPISSTSFKQVKPLPPVRYTPVTDITSTLPNKVRHNFTVKICHC